MAREKPVVCIKCGGVNRLPTGRRVEIGKCGKCGASLFQAHPEDVISEMFDHQIARGTLPVLVDIWAPWCDPCKLMAPADQAAVRELEPDIRLIKLNSDSEPAISARSDIRGIPTMVLFVGDGRSTGHRAHDGR